MASKSLRRIVPIDGKSAPKDDKTTTPFKPPFVAKPAPVLSNPHARRWKEQHEINMAAKSKTVKTGGSMKTVTKSATLKSQ